MASRARFKKLVLGPGGSGDKVSGRQSVVGCTVIADYIDPATDQRTLVLERQQRATGDKPRKSRAKAQVEEPQAVTA